MLPSVELQRAGRDLLTEQQPQPLAACSKSRLQLLSGSVRVPSFGDVSSVTTLESATNSRRVFFASDVHSAMLNAGHVCKTKK